MSQVVQELFEKRSFIVEAHRELNRVDVFLVSKLVPMSRTRIQHIIQQGHVRVMGKVVKANYRVGLGDTVEIVISKSRPETTLVAEKLALHIVYEDDHLLVVNKEAHMVVHPGCGNWTRTLANGLMYHLASLPAQKGNEFRPGIVHRLDKGTSGLLVVAKTMYALDHLSAQFAARTIQRSYQALVWGDVHKERGTVDEPIGRHQSNRRMMAVYDKEGEAKPSITHYEVLERFGYVTLIKCSLETGRTHQIRVHMKWLGHPLFGDPLYGGDKVVKGASFSRYKSFILNCFRLLPHQALHANSLGFVHPITEKRLFFQADIPDSFALVLQKWRRYIY